MDVQNYLLILAIALLVGAAGVGLGVYLYPRLKKEEQGYPYESEIERVLLPFALKGIVAAYRLSGWAIEEFSEAISGMDRKVIADSVYELVPEKLRMMVSYAEFSVFVQKVFDWLATCVDNQADHFDKLFQEWVDDQGVTKVKPDP